MISEDIRTALFLQQDEQYRDFQTKLILTVEPKTLIGVRTPVLKKMAKEYIKRDDIEDFLQDLPHEYFDENQLHAFLISETKDFDSCVERTEAFLPYIDNWATCDQLSPKIFKKHKPELLLLIQKWLRSCHVYTIRFAIGMLMQHFLDADFDLPYPEMVAAIRSDEYYINMMIAWYFATALAKQYDAVLPYIEKHRLDDWVHNKTIQKAVESYRISDEQKAYLKTLKCKARKNT